MNNKVKIIGLFNLILFTSILSFVGCKEKTNYALREQELLDQYIADNNITTEPTSSGLYYIETLAGTGVSPSYDRMVTVEYEGRFLDGTIFDSGTISFALWTSSIIDGWHEGVSYMKEGGKATLIIPSDLAYGPYGTDGIPGYTTLIFDIELTHVQ